MTWGFVAVGVGTAVGAGVSANASKEAASEQADAARNAAGLTNNQFLQSRNDLAPYRTTGAAGLAKLSDLLGIGTQQGTALTQQLSNRGTLSAAQYTEAYHKILAKNGGDVAATNNEMNAVRGGPNGIGYADLFQDEINAANKSSDPEFGSLLKNFTGDDLQNDPGYKFQLSEGTKNLQRSAAAKGNLYSGATLKALDKYGTDYAGTKFNEAFNRDLQSKQAKYNFLAGVTGTGQTSTAQTGQLGAQAVGQAGNDLMSAGAARGAGIVGQANAINGSIGNGINAYQNYSALNRLYPQSTPQATSGNIPTAGDYPI